MNHVLRFAVFDLGTKVAYDRMRQERVRSGLESLAKIAGAAELAQEPVGGLPGVAPGKQPPPPKLGKPLPAPAASATTKSAAGAGCEGHRGVEPELTEKLRQDAEAQVPPVAADTALKSAG